MYAGARLDEFVFTREIPAGKVHLTGYMTCMEAQRKYELHITDVLYFPI